MKKVKQFLFISLAVIAVVACQKEVSYDSSTGGGSSGNNDLIGTWKLLYLHAKTNQTVEATDGVDKEKIVSVSEYYTVNNTGTLTFETTKITGTNLGYTIDTTFKGYFYLNDMLFDSIEVPLYAVIPGANSTANYTLYGSDSLYFPAGGIVDIGAGGQATTPAGAKFKIENGVLTLTQYYHDSFSETDMGVVTKTTQDAFLESFYQKQ